MASRVLMSVVTIIMYFVCAEMHPHGIIGSGVKQLLDFCIIIILDFKQ